MAIFSGAFIASVLAVEATFFTTAIATALNVAVGIAASMALSYAAQAVANKPPATAQTDNFGVQGNLQAAGDVPRSFNLGYSVTAGSLTYANTHGGDTATPNAYLTQVIALADLPGNTLLNVWVNGELVTLEGSNAGENGYTISEYVKPRGDAGSPTAPHLYVKFYDGTQTVADPYLVSTVGTAERPYPSTRVGRGVAYVICTSLVNEKLFSGFPTFKFELSGIPLYDPSKDTTVGGSGSQRYATPATWGGDGDKLPAVQIYNLMRGLYYNGIWVYGLQNFAGSRLPVANWIAQIAKCRATITGEDGAEPTYRAGGQVNVDAQTANTIETLLTSCQGKMSEIGGFYKLHLGAPDSSTFSWTDADLLTSDEEVFKPFFGLSDSVNGIQGTYPDPSQGWNTATAPAYYRTDLEILDGNRRLMASPSFDFVPYPAQVQRLQKSAIEEAQRARTHVLSFPPQFWFVEPGDVGAWTSERNGYSAKLFRADGVVDRANLDVTMSLTEIDHSDYDWDHATEFVPATTGPTLSPWPEAQEVSSFSATATTLYDASGTPRRPALNLTWDGTIPGVDAIQFEARLASNAEVVARKTSDHFYDGELTLADSLLPLESYEVRAALIPSSPRDVLWTSWVPFTTPDVRLGYLEVANDVRGQITTVLGDLEGRLLSVEQLTATVQGKIAAQEWINTKVVSDRLALQTDNTFASIDSVQRVSLAADSAMASSIVTLTATVAGNTASISTNASAISTLTGSLASNVATLTASIGANTAAINTNATAISTLTTTVATNNTTLTASIGANTASITTNSTAITTLNGYAAARYAVTLDVDGYAAGFTLINAGTSYSTFTILVDYFQIAKPGFAGGAAVPIFTIGNVGGSPKVGIRADVFIDGTVTAVMIAANTITAGKIAANTITAAEIAAGTITATQIAANTITAAKIVAGTITATEIAANTITAAKIAAGTITASEIAASTITGAKIAAVTIAAANIVAGTITATELATNSVTAIKILANTITAAKIAAGTITATEIAANTITAAKIAAGTITATELASNSVTAVKITAGVITASHIASATITATQIATGTITATQIAAGTITATELAALSISTAKLQVNSVDINALIAGAATNIVASGDVYLADTVGTNDVLSQSITVSGGGGAGKVLVIASFRSGGRTVNNITGTLTIDGGGAVYSVDYNGFVTSIDPGPPALIDGYTLAPSTFTYLATGLSDASHTFKLRTTRSFVGTTANIVLMNLRR